MEFLPQRRATGSLARTGKLITPHGSVDTPVFMPVGTSGIVKTLAPWELEELGAKIILGNTYHLHLRPGEELIESMGGLHQWSRWSQSILTDSGGYQAYSLGETRGKQAKTSNEGVRFYSHLDGKELFFTPESVLDIQANIGSDIAMVLDDCPPLSGETNEGLVESVSRERVESAVLRTGEWAKRSIDYWQTKKMGEKGRALFGIIQGGLYKDLRLRSAQEIQNLPFDGIAVGGVAIESEGKGKINDAVESVAEILDKVRPHYLMGVGLPEDLIRMVGLGIDMFDCVVPTRFARHGSFWSGDDFALLSISASKFISDPKPLDPKCKCRICQTFSRSYLRYLYMSGEMFALRALSYHNLSVILNLMTEIRQSIDNDSFAQKYAKILKLSGGLKNTV